MTESLILTKEEAEIYNLSTAGKSDEEILRAGYNLCDLKGLHRKIRVVSRERVFYSLLLKYQRIFTIAQDHYAEKVENCNHVFNIDFSDLYTYLNPTQATPEDRANIGCIYYIFAFKSDNHRYCILPTTTWKLLNRVYETYESAKRDYKIKSFNKFLNNTQIYNFYHSLDEGNAFDTLIQHYKDAGGLEGIVKETLNCEIDEQDIQSIQDKELKQKILVIPKMVKDLKKMLKDKVIEPLEDFVKDKDLTKIEVQENEYNEILTSLDATEYKNDTFKKVVALHFTITCGLTKNGVNICDRRKDELGINTDIYPAVYRSVSNSRKFTDIFRAKKICGTFFSCCPQFLSIIILLKNNLVEEFRLIALTEKIARLNEKTKDIKRIRDQCYDLQYPKRFVADPYIKNKKILKENLESVYNYLSDLCEFKYEIYASFIEPIKKINTGDIYYHRNGKLYNSRESIKTLQPLFKCGYEDRYENVAEEALNNIFKDVKETYEFLYQRAKKKKILSPETDLKYGALLTKIEALDAQYTNKNIIPPVLP